MKTSNKEVVAAYLIHCSGGSRRMRFKRVSKERHIFFNLLLEVMNLYRRCTFILKLCLLTMMEQTVAYPIRCSTECSTQRRQSITVVHEGALLLSKSYKSYSSDPGTVYSLKKFIALSDIVKELLM